MSWNSDDDEDDQQPCPYCGRAIYDDAERCPHCENYLSQEDAPRRQPIWIVVCVVLCLLAAFGWVFHG